jgi:hypothetical protein
MTPAQNAARLHDAIGEALQLFQSVDETRTTIPAPQGGWCARQILGHLIDSACNNHRRFVLGQLPGLERYDPYQQDEWVSCQRYEKVPWRDLLTLWTAYNRHLAHVIACVSDDVAAREALAPDGTRMVTLGFLIEDYVRHLRHHLDQLRTRLAPGAVAGA